jgi:predicted ATP-grasp superfamily ATP-dependent carboligase
MKIGKVIILGGHIQALGLARQAHRLDVKVILLLQDSFSVARFSNAVDNVIICSDMGQLKKTLLPYSDKHTLLFPTADDYIEFLMANYYELNQFFVLGIPKPDCVSIFADKRNTYKFAERMDVPHPKSWYPDNMGDVKKISKTAEYPLVVKPAVMYAFHKVFGKKAYRCDSPEELISRCEKIANQFPIDGLVIQEFLSGGAESLFSYGAMVVKGEPIAWVMANRIRQNPMDFGNSTTFAVTCNIPEMEASAKNILKKVEYDGLAEVEFMYDDRTGAYKFLEINTRAWKWHSISMGLGFGFLSEMIHYYNGEKGDFSAEFRKMAWVERLTDFAVCLKSILKGRLKLLNVLHSYCQKKENAVWSWKDPFPAIMYLLQSPILYIKRH